MDNNNAIDTPALIRTDEPTPVAPVALQTVSEIETQIKRLQYLSHQLDLARTACVKVTLPRDWMFHGGDGEDAAAYLEGAGGARIAPLIGLQMLGKPKVTKQALDEGGYSITCEADFACSVFGTTYYGVTRTRRSTDRFLSQNGAIEPDEEDIRQAAYTGMIARAAQLAAGLSGLTRGELKSRFGYDATGATSVTYRSSGAGDVKRADNAAAAPDRQEITRILYVLSGGEEGMAADILAGLTENKQKGWAGKRSAAALTENGVKFVLPKLREMEKKFNADLVKSEGGEE
jgi:hypothetical protein